MTTYADAASFRAALEQRLRNRSRETGIALDRLRRRVIFERVLVRLHSAEPGIWVLKGGMALEVRLRDDARLTKDLDLGMRGDLPEPSRFHERLVEALTASAAPDFFEFRARQPQPLQADSSGVPTWRVHVQALLAVRSFGTLNLDISPRAHELTATEALALPNTLEFAGVPDCIVEVIDVHRHAAEKLHAICQQYGDRENSRVRDLVDVLLLVAHGLLDTDRLSTHARQVWSERDQTQPPDEPPALPGSWTSRYAELARQHGLASDIAIAARLLRDTWPSNAG